MTELSSAVGVPVLELSDTSCRSNTHTSTASTRDNQWRRKEINIVGARRGPKDRSSKPEGLRRGWGSWGGGGKPPPHQLGGLGSAVSSPSWVPKWGRVRSPCHQKFWCILCSSGELSCSPAIRWESFIPDTFAPAISSLRGRAPPFAPAVPMPLETTVTKCH